MESFTISGMFATSIITNSSSVVYTWVDNKDALYHLIDEVLTDVGSDKKAKDLYDIYKVLDDPDYLGVSGNTWSEASLAEKERLTLEYTKSTYDYYDSHYVVVTKSGKESAITKHVTRLFFSAYGGYDG